jgi:hypothetical protein
MIELEDKNPSGKENESSKRNSKPAPTLRSELARGPDQLQETKLRHRRATNENQVLGEIQRTKQEPWTREESGRDWIWAGKGELAGWWTLQRTLDVRPEKWAAGQEKY